MLGLGLGITGKLVKGVAAEVAPPSAHPLAALFTPGTVGVLLDVSQTDLLFQDSAGNNPVTAQGQPVGMIRDLSGADNHAKQALSAGRPTFGLDGAGKPCLALDGIDDWLIVTPPILWGTDEVTIIYAARKIEDGDGRWIVEFGEYHNDTASFGVSPGTAYYMSEYIYGLAYSGDAVSGAVFLGIDENQPEYQAPLLAVGTFTAKRSAPMAEMRINGVLVASDASDQGAGAYGPNDLYIGGGFSGEFYGMLVVNRVLTVPERQTAEAYMSSLCGVTLP